MADVEAKEEKPTHPNAWDIAIVVDQIPLPGNEIEA